MHGTRSHFQLAAYRGRNREKRERETWKEEKKIGDAHCRQRALYLFPLPARIRSARMRDALSTGSGNFLEMTNGRLRGTSIPVLPQIVDLGRVPRRPLNHRDRQFIYPAIAGSSLAGLARDRRAALTRDRSPYFRTYFLGVLMNSMELHRRSITLRYRFLDPSSRQFIHNSLIESLPGNRGANHTFCVLRHVDLDGAPCAR